MSGKRLDAGACYVSASDVNGNVYPNTPRQP